jgi:hypothetical protein
VQVLGEHGLPERDALLQGGLDVAVLQAQGTNLLVRRNGIDLRLEVAELEELGLKVL